MLEQQRYNKDITKILQRYSKMIDPQSDPNFDQSVNRDDVVVYSIEDCILPGYHPPSPYGHMWPDRLLAVSSLLTYFTPALLAICTVGNLLAATAVRRLYPGILSTGLYVFVTLLLDTLVIWSRCGLEWLRLATNTDVRDAIVSSSLVLCKLYPFLSNIALQMSSWLTVAMAAETTWVYQHPQRLMRVCRVRRARVVIITMVVVIVVVNSHCFWTYSLFSTSPTASGQPDETALQVCANDVTDDRISSSSSSGNAGDVNSLNNLDYRKILLLTVDLSVSDLLPFFIVFSCSVMLVTKRLRRRDQVRQIDNTWKACNIDSSIAHQLHTSFIVLCVLHTILLFPKITYKTFLLVTDPHVTGLVPYSVAHRPCTVVAKTICYLLHYFYLSGKIFFFLGASPCFRQECVAVATCFRRLRRDSPDENHVTPNCCDDQVTTGLPLLNPQPPVLTNENSLLMSTPSAKHDSAAAAAAMSSAAILENGAPCIKIFSMTSV